MSWLSDLFGVDRADAAKAAQAQSQAEATRQQQAAAQSEAAQRASLSGAQTDIANTMQSQYAGFDPQAFAKSQGLAASQASAAAARGAGANAGKAARLGNVGLGQTVANAAGQGYGIQSNLGQSAYNARAGITGGYGGMAGQSAQTGMGYQDMANRGLQQAEDNAVAAGNRIAGGVDRLAGGFVGLASGQGLKGFAPQPKEKGGDVKAGEPYIVGEKRAELFVPKTDGVIVPEISKQSLKLMRDFLEVVNKYRKKAA